MTSIFDPPFVHPAGYGCLGHGAGRSDEVYLSPKSESVESPEFEVGATAAIVGAFDLKPGQRVRVEMVTGYRDSTLYAPVIHQGAALALDAANTQIAVRLAGRYRLVAEGVVPGIDMPTIVVLRRSGALQALA